jgi:cell division protease FtsH
MSQLRSGEVAKIVVKGDHIDGELNDKSSFTTNGPTNTERVQRLLQKHDVEQSFKPTDETGLWQSLLYAWGPILLFTGLWFLLFRQLQSGGGKAMSFGKSRAKLLNENQQRVTFADVAGIEEAKGELEEIVASPRPEEVHPARPHPKGVHLIGPGHRQRRCSRARSRRGGRRFSISPDCRVPVGVGAPRPRLFQQGKKNAPCIIFIDEIDAVGPPRGAAGGGHDEREQTLNQLS